ncbi:hypothetical protein [Streptomyces albidoflavus]|uniref:hypothetical protein n=1 Tax=Streptomyces albidoflavus TaxID=1886 RepID=UPI0033D63C59
MSGLATAGSYLRINRRTRAADLVCGAQADYALTEIHGDGEVAQEQGGGYLVTVDRWTVISYTPLHASQDILRSLAPAYQHWAAPADGTNYHVQADMSGKGLGVLITRAPGRFVRTRRDEIAHLQRGRVRNIFRPTRADALAA